VSGSPYGALRRSSVENSSAALCARGICAELLGFEFGVSPFRDNISISLGIGEMGDLLRTALGSLVSWVVGEPEEAGDTVGEFSGPGVELLAGMPVSWLCP
jgi:hypothetical protein